MAIQIDPGSPGAPPGDQGFADDLDVDAPLEPRRDGVAQGTLRTGDRRDIDEPAEIVDERSAHTGTSKTRSASLSEVFSSVDSVRRPTIKAQDSS